MRKLIPTLYVYRVGDGEHWSEWIQFRTASTHEWFRAGGFIQSMIPSIPTPGNHEMRPRNELEAAERKRHLSVQWNLQFTLPLNGIPGLEETVYYVDYQNCRIISLNSNHEPQAQKVWLEENVADGMNRRARAGTVYVVSVSGAKMYRLNPDRWNGFEQVEQDRDAENTQLFQVICMDTLIIPGRIMKWICIACCWKAIRAKNRILRHASVLSLTQQHDPGWIIID